MQKPCSECREPFEATRKDAKYCSDRCRSRARRARKRDGKSASRDGDPGLVVEWVEGEKTVFVHSSEGRWGG